MSIKNTLKIVELSGSLTIANADATRESLLAAMDEGAPVEVDISGATEIDLSLVQLLIAARRAHPLKLRAPAPDMLIQTLQRGGFFDESGRASSETAFLTEGE